MGHGELPGQFKALTGVAIDKQNRVFTTEQFPGRLQVFRYVTDAEAAAEKVKHDEELEKAAERRRKAAADKPGATSAQKTATPPAAEDSAVKASTAAKPPQP
jgi:hypothetical protein